MLFTAIVAIIVIGPKDLPLALRTAGRWIGKIRRVSGHFRSGIETMIRDAELEDMEKKWREQNAAIMTAHPIDQAHGASAEAALIGQDPGTGTAVHNDGNTGPTMVEADPNAPQLPLGKA